MADEKTEKQRLAEELLRTLTDRVGMQWSTNGSARFTAVARYEDELNAIEAAKSTKFTQRETDTIYAMVLADRAKNYDPFARDGAGALLYPKDELHKPTIPDSRRGLYLITQSHERQLEQLRATLGASGLEVQKSLGGDDCVRIEAAESCRYVVKLKQPQHQK